MIGASHMAGRLGEERGKAGKEKGEVEQGARRKNKNVQC